MPSVLHLMHRICGFDAREQARKHGCVYGRSECTSFAVQASRPVPHAVVQLMLDNQEFYTIETDYSGSSSFNSSGNLQGSLLETFSLV